MIKSYTKRLTEVEEEQATYEAEDAIRREKHVRKMFRVEQTGK